MTPPVLANDTIETLHAQLTRAARQESPIEEILAQILATWAYGKGVLPEWLGLGELEFRRMLQHHFPTLEPRTLTRAEHPPKAEHQEEMADLRKLLLKNRSHITDSEHWLADILVSGCMGSDHLWQDLGLWNRAELTKLMEDYFTPLATLNTKNMKWKKFLYKRLCETEGIYTCRAPSCEACADYANCFGPEE
ncbi:MAG: nitrogen fixation protein NifQ [Candidatus Thiodiazotropha sp.]|jgi:nitrogen fixation protein NifQ